MQFENKKDILQTDIWKKINKKKKTKSICIA